MILIRNLIYVWMLYLSAFSMLYFVSASFTLVYSFELPSMTDATWRIANLLKISLSTSIIAATVMSIGGFDPLVNDWKRAKKESSHD